MLEFSGTAVNIDTAKLLLELNGLPEHWRPAVGERVRLELLLPVDAGNSARSVTFRAKVSLVAEETNGKCQVEFAFRRPNFKADEAAEKKTAVRKEATNGWAM